MTTSSPTDLALDYWWNGRLVLRGAVPPDLVEQVRCEIDVLFEDDAHRRAGKVQDAWEVQQGTRDVAVAPEVLRTLRSLYQRRPIPYQTLSYRHGSERRGHADSMHASTIPSGWVCTAWVALDETDASNGPLFFYPGSHHLEELNPQHFTHRLEEFDYRRYEDSLAARMVEFGFQREEFHAQPGDVLLFAGNLVHGGCPIEDPSRPRRCVITQYVFEHCIYYTPLLSDVGANRILLRDDLVDIGTGRRARHSVNGRRAAYRWLGDGRCEVTIDPSPIGRLTAFAREARYRFPRRKDRLRRLAQRAERQAHGQTVRLP